MRDWSAPRPSRAAPLDANRKLAGLLAQLEPAALDEGPAAPGGLAEPIETVRHLRDGPVEVKLRPEELGLVRMTLQQTETALVLQVSAERPDTLDLMRRHAEVLARELADAGFGSVDIDFGSARGGADEDGAPERSGTDSTDTGPGADEAETLPDNALTRRAGLDIRI